MIIDGELVFSSAQALTSTGTTASTNVIDLTTARDLEPSDPPLEIYVAIDTVFTSGGAGTLQVLVQGSTDNSTWTTMAGSVAHAVADLTPVGRVLLAMSLPGPSGAQANPRYIRLAYVIATAAMTAGAVDAYMVVDRPKHRYYPAGINISN